MLPPVTSRLLVFTAPVIVNLLVYKAAAKLSEGDDVREAEMA